MIDDTQVSIPELLAVHGRVHGDKPAIVIGEQIRSWKAFDRGINRVANALLAEGIGRGHRVVVLMGNAIETLECFFGVVRAGACVVPLSGLLTGEQMHRLIDDCQASRVLASAEFRTRLDGAGPRPGHVPAGGWIAIDTRGAAQAGDGELGDWRDGVSWLQSAQDTAPGVRLSQSDPFNIIYSSGTTGLPKGIVQTHRARLHWAFSNAIEMRFHSDCRGLTTTALYSNGTWLTMLPTLFVGGTLHCMPAFDPAGFLHTVQTQRITHTFMVPAQFGMVLAHPDIDHADLGSLQTVLCAGSPLRREVKREVIARFGPTLYELYGFSEGFATMLKPHEHDRVFDSVGTPVLGFDLRILDDAGNVLAAGEVGEIAGYGAGMMTGYYGRPAETEALIWRDERGRSFIRSGDIGRLDDQGYLYLVDRKKDMIISGGFNVFPKDLEEVIGSHPDVADVAVIGVPHEKWGETPLALVIVAASAGPADEAWCEAVRAWANARLAAHQRISAVRVREAFPRNALGKVIKRQLREETQL